MQIRPTNTSTAGFTLVEVIATVVGLFVVISLFVLLVAQYTNENENELALVQIRDYVAALEQSFEPSYGSYPAVFGGDQKPVTDLDQYGCLVPTFDDGCLFNGEEQPLYPSAAGLDRLNEFARMIPLVNPVTDRDGDVFDAILYSSNGTKFRIRYPLVGDGVDCGVQYAYEINADSSEYQGVTICVYESR